MNRIRFTPAAESDLVAIHDHICRNGSEKYATETIRKILKRAEQLSHFPYLGSQSAVSGSNWRSVTEGSYVMYYRSIDDGIELIRVVHGRRDQRKALGQDTE